MRLGEIMPTEPKKPSTLETKLTNARALAENLAPVLDDFDAKKILEHIHALVYVSHADLILRNKSQHQEMPKISNDAKQIFLNMTASTINVGGMRGIMPIGSLENTPLDNLHEAYKLLGMENSEDASVSKDVTNIWQLDMADPEEDLTEKDKEQIAELDRLFLQDLQNLKNTIKNSIKEKITLLIVNKSNDEIEALKDGFKTYVQKTARAYISTINITIIFDQAVNELAQKLLQELASDDSHEVTISSTLGTPNNRYSSSTDNEDESNRTTSSQDTSTNTPKTNAPIPKPPTIQPPETKRPIKFHEVPKTAPPTSGTLKTIALKNIKPS